MQFRGVPEEARFKPLDVLRMVVIAGVFFFVLGSYFLPNAARGY